MANYYCPRCGALLGEDFLRTAGERFDCPECDESVLLATVAPALARREDGPQGPESDVPVEEFREESPSGSRIDCRVADRQLVVYIPPGSNRNVRSIGCFAVVWLGFIGVFTGAFVGAGALAEGGFFLVLFLSVFWLVGLGMLYAWIRGRFGRTYVLVEPDRLVMRFELFGREKYKEYLLEENSRARLEESYRQNDRPVFKIAVRTPGGTASFGTFLSSEEKDWLVARINRHLESG